MTRLLWIVLFSSMLFSGCDKKEEYEGPNSGWDNHTVVALSFFVDDRGEHGFICARMISLPGYPGTKEAIWLPIQRAETTVTARPMPIK